MESNQTEVITQTKLFPESFYSTLNELGCSRVGKIHIDGTKLKGNASAKKSKDQKGYEKWLSEITEEIDKIIKEAEAIDKQEDESCEMAEDQKEIMKKLTNRNYLKSKIEEALKILKEEDRKKINLTDMEFKEDVKKGNNAGDDIARKS